MTQELKTASRKIGRNKGKPRLWIEGKVLIEAGLPHGSRWNLSPLKDGIAIRRDDVGGRKISGKPERPVIDIAASSLGVLQEVQTVTLEYLPQSGVIIVSKAT